MNLKLHIVLATVLLASTTFSRVLAEPILEGFSNVDVEPGYLELLAPLKLEVQHGGARIVEPPIGGVWFVGVGFTVVKNELGKPDLLRRRKVAEQKAWASILETLKGINVNSSTTSWSIFKRGEDESADSSEGFQRTIESQIDGWQKGCKTFGTWYSPGGEIFYLAICTRIK